MQLQHDEYKGHRIELRTPEVDTLAVDEVESEAGPELLIDDKPIRYGQLPDGQYFLHEYAYDWRDNLIDLARGLIDYRTKTTENRRSLHQLRSGEADPNQGE